MLELPVRVPGLQVLMLPLHYLWCWYVSWGWKGVCHPHHNHI